MEPLTLTLLTTAFAILFYELYRRFFVDFGDSEAVATYFAVPFVNRPDLKRTDQVSLHDHLNGS